MTKKMLSITLILLLAASFTAFGCPAEQEVVPDPVLVPELEVFTINMQCIGPAGTVRYKVFADFFVPRIYEASGGRIIIKPFASDMAVDDLDLLDAVRIGTLGAAHASGAYWVGLDPAFAFKRAALSPFTEAWHFDAWLWTGGGIELLRELYAQHGVHLVGAVKRTGETLHLTTYTPTLADFAGQKVRTVVGPTAALMKAVGGVPIHLPGGEIYSALDMGLIDAAEWTSLACNFGLGIHEVSSYFLWPGFHSMLGIDDLFVNMDVWEALPPYLQHVFEIVTREFSFELWYTMLLEDGEAFAKYLAAGNVQLHWPAEDWEFILGEIITLLEEMTAGSPMAARLFESQLEFARDIGLKY